MITIQGASAQGVVPRRRSLDLWVLAGILLAGALVRGLYLDELADHPDFSTPGVDAGTHQYWARGLATGDWTPPGKKPDPGIPTTPYVRPPGYPYFLALVYYLLGTGSMAPRVVQMGLGLLNGVLAFAIGKRWFGRAVGLTWAGFMSLYWAFVYFEGELHAVVLLISLLLTVVYLLGKWAERMAPIYAVAGGGLLGLASLVRPNALPIVLLVPLWMLVIARRRSSARKGAKAGVILILCAAAGILPATLRNYLVADDFVIISANGGINLFIGNNEMATGRPSASIPGVGRFANCYDYPAIVATLERKLGTTLKYSAVSAHFRRQATEYIKHQPLKSLMLTLEKALLFWGPWEIANNKEVHYERVFSAVLSRLPGDFPGVLALAVVGGSILLIQLRKHQGDTGAHAGAWEWRREMSMLIALIVAALFFAVLPFFVCARYRVPVIPFLLLFAAYGACCTARFIAARRWVPAGGWVLGCAAGYAVFSIQIVPGGPDLFRWHYDRGTAYERLGNPDRALECYEETLRIVPDVPFARFAAARLLLRKGQAAEAAAHLRYILRYVHPHQAEAHHLLAQALVPLGQEDQAVVHYREALRVQPDSALARAELARLLHYLGRLGEAVREYELLLTIEPRNVDALFWLGLALREVGRTDEGNRRLLEALELDPGRRASLEALGLELEADLSADQARATARAEGPSADALLRRADQFAAVGRTNEAIESYRKALFLEPERAVVHCKLADLLASDRQFAPARAHYRRALQAKPDLAAAHIGLGMICGRTDDAESAVRHYRAAIRVDPDNVAAHYNLGIVLGDGLGHYEEALDALNRALALTESTGRVDLAERITDRITRFRQALSEQSGDDPE